MENFTNQYKEVNALKIFDFAHYCTIFNHSTTTVNDQDKEENEKTQIITQKLLLTLFLSTLTAAIYP